MLGRVLSAFHEFDCADAFLTLNQSIHLDKEKPGRKANFDDDLLAINQHPMYTKSIESYSHRSNQWTRLYNCRIECFGYRSEYVDKQLIVIGGLQSDLSAKLVIIRTIFFFMSRPCLHRNNSAVFQVYSIDLATKTKTSLQPMLNARTDHTTITRKGYIYAIGGCSANEYLRTAER